MKSFLAYLLRWQISSLILAPCLQVFSGTFGAWGATIIANLIGGVVFFPFDKYVIFRHKKKKETKEKDKADNNTTSI